MNHAPRLLILALVAVVLFPRDAHAGGLYLTDRGVRALGRGGAFVAGADDGQSLWYNPAGLSYAGRKHVLVDGTLSLFRGSFQRITRDDVNAPSPRVDADPMPLPIPTLALVNDFGLDDFSFGIGIMAPNAVMLRWPETAGLTPDGTPIPSPTRHSLISMQGSAIAHMAIGASYRGIKGLSLGLGVHVIASRFHAGVYLSSCDYGILCQQPEQADYEAPAVVNLGLAFTATPMFGLIYESGMFRFGGSLLLFYDVEGTAKLKANLPSAPMFGPNECAVEGARDTNPDCARIRGDKADIRLAMPMIARLGVEVRPNEQLKAEIGVTYEGWSRQQDFSIRPQNIRIENAVGLPTYAVGPISMPRQMQDVWSLRLGSEYALQDSPLTLRAGLILEQSAFPTRTLTPLTLDSKKAVLAFGASYAWSENVFIDVLYAHIFMADVRVRDSIVYPQNPLRPPYQPDPSDPVGAPAAVGNGNYAMEADLIGMGIRANL